MTKSPTQQESGAVRLSIRGLSKTYVSSRGQVQALSDINLDILDGQIVCIVGESGCGKSSLLHILAGFEKPSQGEALMDGHPITGPSHKRAIIFQKSSLLPWLTVERNITLGHRIGGRPINSDKIASLIETMGLRGFERYYPAQLSGGMARRAAIARALASDTNIDMLLLDEPFSALDTSTRLRLQDEFLRIWKLGRYTTVFVTHDLDEALFLGSRIVIMTPRPGRIARIFDVPPDFTRDRVHIEFLHMRNMIGHEFAALTDRMNVQSRTAGSS
ncbi:MAG TPA: ABC transporter ATP-binding protein [Syntrophobacteraceae bacterium]|nr:ABC transporter ATP-binding protein [Syntrophobacteraceae bacterium]